MSYKAIAWAYDMPLRGPQKPVLVALADMADEAASCFPGQKRLSEMTGLSVKTVSRALARLEETGLIRRERRVDAFGHRTSDRYHLQLRVSLPESLTDSLPTGLSAYKADSPSLTDSQSIPNGQSDRGTIRRTTSRTTRTDIKPVSPVTNALNATETTSTDGLEVFASEVGVTDLEDLRKVLSGTLGHSITATDALVFAQEVGKLALEPVTNLTGYVVTACQTNPAQVRDWFASAELGVIA